LGGNLVLVSPYQELVKDTKNGQVTYQNRREKKGEDRSDGKAGQSAGHVHVVANK
jgi:hypothetical protein